MLQKNVVEEIKTHMFMFNEFLPKILLFMRYVDKYGRARQATGGNIIWRMCCACWIIKARI
jgi:hypothetical protein